MLVGRALRCVGLAAGSSSNASRHSSGLTQHRYPQLQRNPYDQLTDNDVQVFEGIVGAANVLQQPDDVQSYNTDWLGIYKGASGCVVRPADTEQCAAVVKHCHDRMLAVCPQGGNTGLVGGGVPVFDEVVLSTSRMNQDIQIDAGTGILRCSAGWVLEALDDRAAAVGLMMPLDLGAKGSCHIGGNVATAAGGMRLIRYGSLHAHVLGLTVVQADGTVLRCGSDMRKDNTGLHVAHLFVGSEGALGIITEVTMTLVPRPAAVNLAFFSLDSFAKCLELLRLARSELSEVLSSFEFMDAATMRCVTDNLQLTNPLAHTDSPFYVLVETSGSNNSHDAEKMESMMGRAMELGVCSDGVLSQSEAQRTDIWKLREGGAEALRRDGHTYKQDFSLPHEHYYAIADATRERLGDLPTRVVLYGHLADGNAHLNVTSPEFDPEIQKRLYPWLYEWVSARGGSISAEHGIGFSKRMYSHYSQSPSALRLAQHIKQTLDPKQILNPYKVVPPLDG